MDKDRVAHTREVLISIKAKQTPSGDAYGDAHSYCQVCGWEVVVLEAQHAFAWKHSNIVLPFCCPITMQVKGCWGFIWDRENWDVKSYPVKYTGPIRVSAPRLLRHSNVVLTVLMPYLLTFLKMRNWV
jgi:hypothetical protein